MSTNLILLPGEYVVMSSDRRTLTLTNKRVRYDSRFIGRSSLVSITLASVSSCGVITRSYPVLLVLAAAALAAAALYTERNIQTILVWSAAVVVILYFASRRALISICSNGGDAICVPVKGMSRAAIIDFLDAIEREKLGC